MKYLLDSHVFLWMDLHPEKLSQAVVEVIENPSNILFLSTASIWEMQLKIQAGKLKLSAPLPQVVAEQQNNLLRLLHLRTKHIYTLEKLPYHHRDPFDRMLISQTMVEKLTLISHDEIMKDYDIPVLW